MADTPAPKDKTVAPTNQHTLDQVEQLTKPKLTELQANFVTLVVMYYGNKGKFLPQDVAESDYYITPTQYAQLIKAPEVLSAIREWNVDVDRLLARTKAEAASEPTPLGAATLTPLQLLTVNSLLNLSDPKSERKKLQDLNVDLKLYDSWKRDPVFMDYFKKRTERLFDDAMPEANVALIDKIRAGDPRAIKLYMEMQGRIQTNTGSSNASVTVNNLNVDYQNLMVQMVEIIHDEVDDPEVLKRLSGRIRDLASFNGTPVGNHSNTVAGEILTVPEPAPIREVTPELQAMIDAGGGVNS